MSVQREKEQVERELISAKNSLDELLKVSSVMILDRARLCDPAYRKLNTCVQSSRRKRSHPTPGGSSLESTRKDQDGTVKRRRLVMAARYWFNLTAVKIFVKNLAGIAGISEEDVHILESDGAGLLHFILDMKEEPLAELLAKVSVT